MKQQKVVRTRPTGNRYSYEPDAFDKLSVALSQGYTVVRCTPIGNDLEYILEREEHQTDKN